MAFERVRALLPPVALFGGLLLFGASLLILGSAASQPASEPLHASSLTIANGTSVLVYPTPPYTSYYARTDVHYEFPTAQGYAYYLDCADTYAVLSGGNATEPMMKFGPLRTGTFVVSSDTVDPFASYYAQGRRGCLSAVVFTWEAVGNDPEKNQPTVSVVLTETRYGDEAGVTVIGLSVGGAILSLLGGLAWARQRPIDAPPAGEGTAESLRRSLDSMGAQLERTRRHLLFAGVLGIFLWYPILVPWTWRVTRATTADPVLPWFVGAATFLFLVALTILWAREFLRLDREVRAWRARMDELRAREAGLLSSLDQSGPG